ncbi:MAG: xanthan lyase [Bacteroidaceae bacterium]|nr:xanthan lyase [Bacteroidaceae bacterium]
MRRVLTWYMMVCCLTALDAVAQDSIAQQVTNLDSCICVFFDSYKRDFRTNMPVNFDHYAIDHEQRTLDIYAKEGFASQVFTPTKVEEAYSGLRSRLPAPYCDYNLRLFGFDREIATLIPNIYRTDKDSSRLWINRQSTANEWTRNISRPISFSKGLQGTHMTIWPSHGRYYDHSKKKWRWQRPNLWCTTEDMFTRSFVVPFLLPMLENAGAVAYCPRERDWHAEEMFGVVSPDSGSYYPVIPYADDYAVYVRYPVAENAADDAIYTIKHGATYTKVRVNQQMGGGTWTYLGTFHFSEGESVDNSVTLSCINHGVKAVLPSEVRIGGGMGSIERGGKVSGMPRFLEGSRYYAEYAGFPQYVYDTKDGQNDYADDINVRSNALNYLAGGSCYLPDTSGVGVPMELSIAVHSDAGWFKENRPFGTLAIYTIKGDADTDTLLSGVSRMANSDLACIMQDNICRDLTAALGTDWPHREIYNRNYSESRKPEVPSMILETLSHQNFQDMLYGHDPNFKFILSRAIYKAIVRFTATQHGREYVIQPLPVSHFVAEARDSVVQLRWKAQVDSLEPTAMPTHYIIYCAREGEDFDNGTVVECACTYNVPVDKDKVYRFRVTACNEGGESWPSEILSAVCASEEEERVMIVNGFTRLSSPAIIETSEKQGFDLKSDIGVPYINTAEYCGAQTGFNRANIGSTAKDGLGFSGSELEGKIIGGNSFDYPYVHAKALRSDARVRSISSCSMDALLIAPGLIAPYTLTDIIFGLQKDCGRSSIVSYKTFTPELRALLASYFNDGGSVLMSGSYVGSDVKSAEELDFVMKYLGYTPGRSRAEHKLRLGDTHFSLIHQWNPRHYAATAVDVLKPAEGAESLIEYHNGECAAVATPSSVVMGFPLEAIADPEALRIVLNRAVQRLLYKF